MNRNEHLQWCKDRANQLSESGDVNGAFASFQSDMGKHDDTKGHIALDMMSMLFFGGQLNGEQKMTKFINDFN